MTTPRYIAGIDPGRTGAIAVLDTVCRTLLLFPMQLDDEGHVCAGSTSQLFRNVLSLRLELIVLEEVHAMPKQGVTSSFTFGRAYGLVEEAAAALGVPMMYAPPHVWKKAMGLSSDKNESRRLAQKLFSASAGFFARVKDEGLAEAALLAEYGCRRAKLQERIE